MSLRESVAFDSITATPDGYGGEDRTWEEQHGCRAEFIYQRGSEAVDAARLQGKAVFKVKIRSCAAAREISTDDRMRDVRRGADYNIREVDAITDPRWVYIVVEAGVAI
jgi:head-tail adaptor